MHLQKLQVLTFKSNLKTKINDQRYIVILATNWISGPGNVILRKKCPQSIVLHWHLCRYSSQEKFSEFSKAELGGQEIVILVYLSNDPKNG